MQFANGVLLLWSSSSLRSAKPRDWLHQNFRSLDKFPLNFLQYMGHRISIALSIVPIQYTISTVVSLIHKCHTVVTFPCREARSWDIQRWLTIGNHPTQTSTTLILAPGVCVWQHLPHTSGSGWSWLTEHETWREHLFHLPPQELGTIYEADAGDLKGLDHSIVAISPWVFIAMSSQVSITLLL